MRRRAEEMRGTTRGEATGRGDPTDDEGGREGGRWGEPGWRAEEWNGEGSDMLEEGRGYRERERRKSGGAGEGCGRRARRISGGELERRC